MFLMLVMSSSLSVCPFLENTAMTGARSPSGNCFCTFSTWADSAESGNAPTPPGAFVDPIMPMVSVDASTAIASTIHAPDRETTLVRLRCRTRAGMCVTSFHRYDFDLDSSQARTSRIDIGHTDGLGSTESWIVLRPLQGPHAALHTAPLGTGSVERLEAAPA